MIDFIELNKISMLDIDNLTCLHTLAKDSKQAILEIGPYMGGSTIAMASAVKEIHKPFITIEVGGLNNNKHLPCDNILETLHKNLDFYGLGNKVKIIPEMAHKAFFLLPFLLNGNKIDLLFIDADGDVAFYLKRLSCFLSENCVLVFDDYDDPIKGVKFRDFLSRMVNEGIFELISLSKSVWIGKIKDKNFASKLDKERLFIKEGGHCWITRDLLYDVKYPIGDSTENPNASNLMVFEDGKSLGPVHSLHQEIRDLGFGRFSHWGDYIYLSTSDNSDPKTNGRKYTVKIE